MNMEELFQIYQHIEMNQSGITTVKQRVWRSRWYSNKNKEHKIGQFSTEHSVTLQITLYFPRSLLIVTLAQTDTFVHNRAWLVW